MKCFQRPGGFHLNFSPARLDKNMESPELLVRLPQGDHPDSLKPLLPAVQSLAADLAEELGGLTTGHNLGKLVPRILSLAHAAEIEPDQWPSLAKDILISVFKTVDLGTPVEGLEPGEILPALLRALDASLEVITLDRIPRYPHIGGGSKGPLGVGFRTLPQAPPKPPYIPPYIPPPAPVHPGATGLQEVSQ